MKNNKKLTSDTDLKKKKIIMNSPFYSQRDHKMVKLIIFVVNRVSFQLAPLIVDILQAMKNNITSYGTFDK